MSARRDVALRAPNTHRTKSQTDAHRSEERQRAYELRLRGRTLRQIADDMGIDVKKVHTLLREEIKLREDPFIDQVRQFELDRLDGYQQACMYVLDNPGKPFFDEVTEQWHVIVDEDKILKAIDRLVRISESRRKLLGVDAPVKTQVDVVETTQQDLEIQELIREAQARAAAGREKINMNGSGPHG
jgi:hypothetical protein